ncbi:HNH endonuclease [Euhalothece natronophila Z-M001]|uniref:HNH endonuclease n=1 Tax=Euhalothece natronophila Z-M001 TaxID=522448 RepID=A0A5B8NLZ7_9CHRO|nr:RNA-guided endonuclease IscB [Euhalothece natronophila]QDZ39967.1 HNH endonuclease [Euhalothece natronophila Z-M001]
MSNYVFVIDQNQTPLKPVHPKRARQLLSFGKAAVFRLFPFTLILKQEVSEPNVHPLILKIDPGSQVTGFALVTEGGEVVWRMQLEHRGGIIKKRLEQRRALRRQRRSRLRYRKPRFLNRKRKEGWLPPSLMHRVQTTETWVKRLLKFCPIQEIWIERVKFDTQLMENPEISGQEYQQGTLQGYTVREYLLEKWYRKCTYCKKEGIPLQVEHIYPRSKGGSNRVSNLGLACEKCNQKKGNTLIEDFLKRKPTLLESVLKQAKTPLKDTSAVNATRKKIVEVISKHSSLKTATGAQTKMNRVRLGLPKEHCLDAACVGEVERLTILSDQPLMVTATGTGGRQKCQTNKFGYPIKHRPLRPIQGFQTGDIVKVDIPKGKNQGQWRGRLCPYSDGNCEIYPKGRKRLGTKLSYVSEVMHRKDGYKYRH